MKLSLARQTTLGITLCTGFTGLVYEVTWHSYLANLLGSHAKASCLILSTFLGGLAIGYALFGRISRGMMAEKSLRLCALVEFLIGIWALCFPALYTVIWNTLFVQSQSVLLFVDELMLAMLFILPPTILMGGTLPLLTQGLSITTAESSRFHARLYAVNTAGAFLGALMSGFLMLPRLGLPGTLLSAAIVNIGAGIGLRLISQNVETAGQSPDSSKLRPHSDDSLSLGTSIAWSLLAGFYAITLQMLCIRMVGLTVGSSEYAFATIVGTFIMLLAIGAAREANPNKESTPLWINQSFVVLGLIIAYLIMPIVPYSAHLVRISLTSIPPNFYVFHLFVLLGFTVVLGTAVSAMGGTLPLLFSATRRDRAALGKTVGYVYGFNTVGCVLGATLGGYAALFIFNIDQMFRICTVMATLPLFAVPFFRRDVAKRSAMLAAALILVIATLDDWPKERFAVGTFRIRQPLNGSFKGPAEFHKSFNGFQTILAYKDDPNTTMAITENGGSRSIVINGKSDGSTSGGDRHTTKTLAHLPALLQTSTSGVVAVVGFGTGITVGSLSLHESIKKIQILEISSAVRANSGLFDRANNAASKSEKIEWHVQDAYRFLLTSPYQYAVIASEPSNPWVSGIERLYSKELYEIARKKLAPGGIYAQWFHTYSISQPTFEIVLGTFRSAFPHVHLFNRGGDVIILGSNEPIERENLILAASRFQSSVIKEDLSDIGIRSFEALLADEVWLPDDVGRTAKQQSLIAPILAYNAGFDFFTDATTSVSSYVEAPNRRAGVNAALNLSLLGQLRKYWPYTYNGLRLAQVLCRSEQPQFSPGWQRYPYPCRAALLAGAVDRSIAQSPPNQQDEVNSIRTLLKRETGQISPMPLNIDRVINALVFYSANGSAFVELDRENVEDFSAPCRDEKNDARKRQQCNLVLAEIAY